MNNYTAPQRDMKFALFDVLESEKLFAKLGIANADRETMDAVLEEAAKFTQGVLAPLNSVGDEHG
ncbi:MAG TPA: acyl-CoA dehydrogenase N-terminal domain-containing protein, partial [Arenimonas sp.]|nr:acyl-CoA dehydrogenase N-terminal domain-containing protein [Arenimonas sp.]